jgi:hypothetical protein
MTTITIVDESMVGERRRWELELLEEHLSLREIIRRRIYQEVTEYNAQQKEYFHGLVQPTDAERTLNGYRLRSRHTLDWQAQYDRAIASFCRNGYVVLVNDRQVTELDVPLTLPLGTKMTFLKLVPLIGG